MKNNKKTGVTLAVLLTTVIVAIVLLTTITISYNGIKNSTKKKEFAKEIYSVQKLVEQYKFINNKYPVLNDREVTLSTLDTKSKIQFSLEPGYASGIIVLKEIDLYKAGADSISRGTKESENTDVYLLSENTGNIYYLKGEKIQNVIYYTLTDDLKEEIGLK